MKLCLKKMSLMIVFGTLSFSLSSHAKFIDEREIDYKNLSRGTPQISESEFNKRISDLISVYKPIVANLGGRLDLQGLWKNDKIVAQATQQFGSWKIQFSGGLARRPELTPDGMTLIICHELGHHLGGFPFSDQGPIGPKSLANEGQADYYSTQVCARRMWAQQLAINETFRTSVPASAQAQCDRVHNTQTERDLCYRTAVASQSIIATMAALKNVPMTDFATPDQTIATATVNGHPKVQCRMDTLLQGSICLAPFDDKVIPGKKVGNGINNLKQEDAAKGSACTMASGYSVGLRPACWFKARM